MPARARTLSLAAFLFALNVYVCRGLFRAEYLRHMGSIEGAYIGISRYAMEHFPDLSWFAPWYDGVPYQNTYPPLLHWIVALVAKILGWSAAHAHHAVTGGMYALGPVALFALALIFSKSRVAAFLAGLLYTALSLSAWLIEPIANDLGSFLNPRRLQALVYYGEGPARVGTDAVADRIVGSSSRAHPSTRTLERIVFFVRL
jgi:4-amino-4-deoxy-L-arabinose transferase-like glycosyltransferase